MTTNAATQPALLADTEIRRSRGLFRDGWNRLMSSWNGRVGLFLIVLTLLVGVGTPLIDPYDARIDSNLAEARKPPSLEDPFGTDRLGRDVFRRVMHGTRISLWIGFVVVFVSGSIGTILGLMAGYFGGWLDTVIMRLMDVLLAFPSIRRFCWQSPLLLCAGQD
jgi:peptide/nickel transport system permease protein